MGSSDSFDSFASCQLCHLLVGMEGVTVLEWRCVLAGEEWKPRYC